MNYITIIYFIVMMWGIGYSLTSLLKLNKFSKGTEKFIMQLGIGLGTFPILAIILNTLYIPLIWYIFLILALIIPLKDAYKYITTFSKEDKPKFKFRLTKSNLALMLIFLIFFIHLSVYLKGAFIIPYLEDGDPWTHADTSQYIAEQKSYSLIKSDWNKDSNWNLLHYTEPYPPGFPIMNAMLYQINPNMKWVLKFFNSFIISLGILFFFFFMSNIMKSRTKGVFSAFLLAVVPCYMSHFIFSTTLAVTLFFPAFYALSKIDNDKRWIFIVGIISASIFVTQPIAAGIFGIMLGVYWISGIILHKNFQENIILSMILGISLSLIYYIPTLIKFGFEVFAKKLGFFMFLGENKAAASYGKFYTFKDYLISPISNMIDQPSGFGPFFFIGLLIIMLFFILAIKKIYQSKDKNKSRWIIFSYIIAILTFTATQSNHFEYTFFPSRVWCYLAIATVMLLAFGIFSILNSFKLNKRVKSLIMLIFIIGLIWTSAVPKYKVQTSNWPADYGHFPPVRVEGRGMYSPELSGYLWMEKNVEWGSNTFILCSPSDQFSAGVNMGSQSENLKIRQFRSQIATKDAKEILNFAKENNYDYLTIGLGCVSRKVISVNKTQELIGEIAKITEPVHADQNGMFIFKL